MTVTFLPLESAQVDRVVQFMAMLYGPWHDEQRARLGLHDLMATPENGGAWLIQADGAIAGYLILAVGYSLEFHGRFGLLDELFVDPAWRGRGLGTQAVAFAEEWCRSRGITTLRLEVAHSNQRALALYRRCGFEAPDRHLISKQV